MGVAIVLAISGQTQAQGVLYCRDPMYPELAEYCTCPLPNEDAQGAATVIKNTTNNQDICLCKCGLVSILQWWIHTYT